MTTTIVRPAKLSDLDRLEGMIARVDPGMLTMPSSREAMAARIERSLAAFARPSVAPQNECYFLVMEEDGELLGTASIFTNLGVERPFYSYRISRDAKVSPELDVKVELDLLFLVNDYHGDSELGTLFIERKARGGGRGRLLSFARLMLIAADPIRFGPKAMAEIRGFTDSEGRSPFWDAVGAKFFQMEYRKADALSARDHRFIADLMPRYPIYMSLLPDDARNVIARPASRRRARARHAEGAGFPLQRRGRHLRCRPDGRGVHRSCRHCARSAPHDRLRNSLAGPRPDAGLLANPNLGTFAVTQFAASDDPAPVLARIGAGASDDVMVYRLKGSRP